MMAKIINKGLAKEDSKMLGFFIGPVMIFPHIREKHNKKLRKKIK